MTTKTPRGRAKTVKVSIPERVRAVLDHAARLRGQTLSEFVIAAAHRAAEDTLPDQIWVAVDAESYRYCLAILARPAGGEGYERLMKAPTPW